MKDNSGVVKYEKDHITEIVEKYYTKLCSLNTNKVEKIHNVDSERLSEINNDEIEKALTSTKNVRAPGEDSITKKLLQREELFL